MEAFMPFSRKVTPVIASFCSLNYHHMVTVISVAR